LREGIEIVADSTETAKTGLAHFVIDSRASSFKVQSFAAGILSAAGHNPTIGIEKFAGEVEFDPETNEGSGFRLTIQASSLGVRDDISDKDRREIDRLMKDEVLEVGKYPEIQYESSHISISRMDLALYSAAINGRLSFHGVARSQPVTARIAALGEILRASGTFNLKQSDYNLKPVSVAGGALRLKDELRFSLSPGS
jgi:polyisoprenoid-binding protein YceI